MKKIILLLIFVSSSTFTISSRTPTRLNGLPMDVLNIIGKFVGKYTSLDYPPQATTNNNNSGEKLISWSMHWNPCVNGYTLFLLTKQNGTSKMDPFYIPATFDSQIGPNDHHISPKYAEYVRIFLADH